jgi:glucose-6-phosphate dehydrogenase assembly protein OpcA
VMAVDPMEPVLAPQTGEIELGRVERELAALWAQAAPEDPGAEPAVLRACSLSLLVLGSSSADLERARPIAARTTLAHPSRVLLLAPDPGAGRQALSASGERISEAPVGSSASRLAPGASPGIGARISTFCHRLGGGGRHVCCEEITVLARGAATERLREAALPLLVPDLPVRLWLPGPAPHDPAAVRRLAELADEVIWSARGPEDRLFPPPHRARAPAIVDLDWLCLQPWRELTAQFFDAPERRPQLERLETVEIEVAGPPPERPGAGWLWVGWLASRLGWQYQGDRAGGSERRLVGPDGAVRVRVRTREDAGLEAGEPLAVRLRLRGEAEPLLLERQTADEPGDLWISVGGGRCVHLGCRDEAALLSEALGGAARDRIYEAAWETAVLLMAGAG